MTSTNKIHKIENHHEAYFLWRKNQIKNQILVHIDAHIDYQQNELSLIDDDQIEIGNYIYPAVRNGVVSSIFWVIPGNSYDFIFNLLAIKKILQRLQEGEKTKSIKYRDGMIVLELESTKIHVCTLETLPKISQSALLDIDVDFFINRSLYEGNNTSNLNKKIQWLTVDSFTKQIRNKIKNTVFTTIAYSTEGGWTPIKYRSIGDELERKLFGKEKDENSNVKLSSKYLKKFKQLLNQNKLQESKKYYLKYLDLNKKVNPIDLNSVFLYLKTNQINLALKEVQLFLKIDPKNCHYLMQLGAIYLKQGKLSQAKKYFQKASKNISTSNQCIIYLCYIEMKQDKWKNAEKLLKIFVPKKNNGVYFFLKGLVFFHNNIRNSANSLRKLSEKPMDCSIPEGMEDLEDFLHNTICKNVHERSTIIQ